MTTTSPAAVRDRVYLQRWWTLLVLSLSLVIIVVDNTIVNVALPAIQRDLNATAADLQWIVDSYIVVFAGLLLVMGSLGDRFGRRRALQVGLLVFGAASVLGAFAGSNAQLIAARIAMGLGGALIVPATLAIIVAVFPREERTQAIGIWTGVAGLGIPLGPVVGGWLVEHAWWGAAFLANVPIAIVALIAGWVLVPKSRDPEAAAIDFAGAALSTSTLALFVYAVVDAPSSGWFNPTTLGAFAASLALGELFVAVKLRVAKPMLDVRLFQDRRFAAGTAAITIGALALAGFTFTFTQVLQFVLGLPPFAAGLTMLPLAAGFLVGAGASRRLIARVGTRGVVAAGLATVSGALVLFVSPGTDTALFPVLMVLGAGLGSTFVPATAAVLSAIPESKAGVGSAVNDAARQVGYALGVGVIGSVLNSAYVSGMLRAAVDLPESLALVARNSIGGATRLAETVGEPAGEALRHAANDAFLAACTSALVTAAIITAAGSILVLRSYPEGETR